MYTRAPSIPRILLAAGFALSCFGLLVFLWITFGGPLPLSPQGYRFTVPFDEAAQLAVESDVRISGVSVGKVKSVELAEEGAAEAAIELQAPYAPIPADTRAILRQKTLLGETYIELSPGSASARSLPEGGRLPAAQVSDAVQLDEIFRAFDADTRSSFQAWMQGQAGALRGRGEDLSIALSSLEPFAEEADRVLRILDSQRLAVRRLVRDGGEVFEALSERRGQLRGLISNADSVFETTAARDSDLGAAFTALPPFLRESRTTLTRLEDFARQTDPLVLQLRPAAHELAPTLVATGELAPELEAFLRGLRGAIDVAPSGFGALRGLLDDELPPLLGRLDPFLRQLTPIVAGARRYRHEITAFLANVAAATNARNDEGAGPRHYLRTTAPFGPEILAAFPGRLSPSRTNPYVRPRGYRRLAGGLESFETRHCSPGLSALLDLTAAADPAFNLRTGGDVAEAQDLLDRIQRLVLAGEEDTDELPAPACVKQARMRSIGGTTSELSDYLHVRELP